MKLEENPDQLILKEGWYGFFRFIWLYWLAWFRLSKYAVCVMSQGRGMIDYHDYHDTAEKFPDHFSTLKCERCGKEFTI